MKKPTPDQILRRCRFAPYRKGMGPTFSLVMWDTMDYRGDGIFAKHRLGYRLTMHEPGKAPVVLFTGEDFGASPCHAIDADETVCGLMGFLTLRPGDTDREYFEEYTETQKDYCDCFAESLSCEVSCRFDPEGRGY